jgi:hypothetical protein
MRGFNKVDFEMDAMGPKIRFDLWKAKGAEPDFAAKLTAVSKTLNLAVSATRLARRGIPTTDSTERCSLEHAIDNEYTLVADDEVHAATTELAVIAAEGAALAGDILGSAYANIQSDLEGTMCTIETRFAGEITGPVKEAVNANVELKVFHHQNESENEPTQRSLFQWAVSALIVAVAESLVNSFMFHDELGFLPGAGFAFVVGLGFAAIGTFAGIGISQLRRKQAGRKIIGGVLLVVAAGVGLYYLNAMGDYRAGLALADAGTVPQTSSPFTDFTILPFLILSVVGMCIIGAKAIPMFGYLDLQRLRARRNRAEKRAKIIIDAACDKIDQVQEDARTLAEGVAKKAQDNATLAESFEAKAKEVTDRCARRVERCADAAVAEQLRFREIVVDIQSPEELHARFKIAPLRIQVALPTVDSRQSAFTVALEARAVAMRDGLSGAIEAIDAAANASRERAGEILADAERSSRPGRSTSPNVFNFRR